MWPLLRVIIFVGLCLQYIVLFLKYLEAAEVNINNAKNVELYDLMTLLIPTSDKIVNVRCRNHSLYYLEKARKFTLWATESKYLPTYNTQNFLILLYCTPTTLNKQC